MANSVLANRVYVNIATTGTGTVTVGAARSNAFCTPAEAGITDGQVCTWLLEEGNDFELFQGAYTASGTTVARTTTRLSKIGGTAGTSHMTLAGAATLRLIIGAEDFNQRARNAVAMAIIL